MLIPTLLLPDTGYTIENSFAQSSYRTTSPRMYRGYTNAQTDTSIYKKTYSAWYKRTALDLDIQMLFSHAINTTNRALLWFDEQDNIRGYTQNLSDGARYFIETTNAYRDSGEWYHVVVAVDSTQGTQADRFVMYVNGVEVTEYATAPLLALNALTFGFLAPAAGTWYFSIGAVDGYYSDGTQRFDGLIADFHCVDGQQLTADDFGFFDAAGKWQPKEYTGTYGNTGFHLDFADSSDMGKDVSGNGNHFTTTGVTTDLQSKDTPTNNVCVLNSQDRLTYVPTEGGLQSRGPATGNTSIRGTHHMRGGKWYWEAKLLHNVGSGQAGEVGITDYRNKCSQRVSDLADSYVFGFGVGASLWYGRAEGASIGTLTGVAGTTSLSTIMNVAVDLDNGDMWVGKDGTWYNSGDPVNGTNPTHTGIDTTLTYLPAVTPYMSGSAYYFPKLNYGQFDFDYTPPAGFKALTTNNMDAPEIANPTDYFDVTLYAGNSADRSITGFDFSPDMVWLKNRSAAWSHMLFDSTRGAFKSIFPDASNSEFDYTSNDEALSSFDSAGFSLRDGTNRANYNVTGNNYVAWCWDEGVTPGLDVITYVGDGVNGRTVSHNLGVKPGFIITKTRDSAVSYVCYHKELGATKAQFLDLAYATQTTSVYWNDTEPTSSVITLGTNTGVNADGDNYVMYAFAEIEGFSKFGTYIGNGSTFGSFVYCGFEPAFIMIKPPNALDWVQHDLARGTTNPIPELLYPSLPSVEYTGPNVWLDILSNGFKLRTTNTYYNTNTTEYLFMAFAKHPFQNARAK